MALLNWDLSDEDETVSKRKEKHKKTAKSKKKNQEKDADNGNSVFSNCVIELGLYVLMCADTVEILIQSIGNINCFQLKFLKI